jgi:hypothetical protein
MFIRYVELSGMNLDSDFYMFRPIFRSKGTCKLIYKNKKLSYTAARTYPSLLLSLFQRPCLFHTLSLISELAAAVAAPDLIECRPSFNPLETNLILVSIFYVYQIC